MLHGHTIYRIIIGVHITHLYRLYTFSYAIYIKHIQYISIYSNMNLLPASTWLRNDRPWPFLSCFQEMPGSMDLNAREQHIVVGNNTARMNTSMIESNHHVSLDDGNLEHLYLEGKGEVVS